MKRILALLIVAIFAVGLASAEGMLAGGWTPSADPAVTKEVREVFDKGLEGLVGVGYAPVAYLGSQVVSGTNHCFLAQATAVVPDAAPHYVLVYLHEGFDGSVEIMNIADFDIGAYCEY